MIGIGSVVVVIGAVIGSHVREIFVFVIVGSDSPSAGRLAKLVATSRLLNSYREMDILIPYLWSPKFVY